MFGLLWSILSLGPDRPRPVVDVGLWAFVPTTQNLSCGGLVGLHEFLPPIYIRGHTNGRALQGSYSCFPGRLALRWEGRCWTTSYGSLLCMTYTEKRWARRIQNLVASNIVRSPFSQAPGRPCRSQGIQRYTNPSY